LRAHRFDVFIVTGGGADVRAISRPFYAVSPDAEREYAYEGRAGSFETEGSFAAVAAQLGFTVASMRRDWATVFPATPS
jgi:hypothetical protein